MYEVDKIQYLQIGVQGENDATDIEIDMSAWVEKYPNAVFHLLFKPYNAAAPSPMVTTYEDGVLTWTVDAGATAVVGVGYTEIRAQDSETGLVKKTRIIPTAVENSVSGVSADPPASYQAWVTDVLNAGAAAMAYSQGKQIKFEIDEDTGHLMFSYTDDETVTEDTEWTSIDLGPVDAYAMAVLKGYTGTAAEFAQYMANIANGATAAAASATAAAASAAEAAQYTSTAVHTWLSENIDPDSGYALDRTLSEPLEAAPADMVGSLKSVFNWETGNNNIQFINGKYIRTDGSTVDITDVKTGEAYCYAVIDVTPGMIITLTGKCYSAVRLWCFIKPKTGETTYDRVTVESANATREDMILYSPADATKLVINCDITEPHYACIGRVLRKKTDNVQKAVFTYGEPLTEGYLNDSGVVQTQSTTYWEKTTDFIPVSSRYLWYKYDTINSHGHRLQILKYDANKEVLASTAIESGASATITHGVVEIDPSTVKFVRFWYYGYKYPALFIVSESEINDVSEKLAQYTDNRITEVKTDISNVKDFSELHQGVLTDGYILPDGSIHEQTVYKEVYTDYIPINFSVFYWYYTTVTAHAPSASVAYYDSNKGFMSLSTIISKSTNIIESSGIIDNIPFGAAYMRVWYRAYAGYYGYMKLSGNSQNVLATYLRQNVSTLQKYAVNEFIKGIAHKGYSDIYPQNTGIAMIEARKAGFKYVESDLSWTQDGVPVMTHDHNINSTARNADGTELSETIAITDIDYEDLLDYDFGYSKSPVFAGEKILKYEDLLTICRNCGLQLYVDIKYANGGTEQRLQDAVDMAYSAGMEKQITFISDEIADLQKVHAYDASIRLGYAVTTISQSNIDAILALKGTNEVLIDVEYTAVSAGLALCKSNKIPLEVWTVNNDSYIKAMDTYISGCTSDKFIAGYVKAMDTMS